MDSPQPSLAVVPDVANLHEALRFLDALAPDGHVTFQTFDDSKDKDPSLARILHGTLEQHAPELTRLNQKGAGVFVMVNRGDGRGRKAGNVCAVRALFADADGAPLEPLMNYAPFLTVESSPGRYHAYFKVIDCPIDQFTAMQTSIASKFGSDPNVKDLPRVMRLPGFLHRKCAPFMTRILTVQDASPIALKDFESLMGFDPALTVQDSTPRPLLNVDSQPYTPNDMKEEARRRITQIMTNAKPGERHAARLRAGKLAGGFIAGGILEHDATMQLLHAVSDDICDESETDTPYTEWQAVLDGVTSGLNDPLPNIRKSLDTSSIGFGQVPLPAGVLAVPPPPPPPYAAFPTPDPIMLAEWVSAKSTPPCIVQDYLFADVAVFIAPGGMGKTTLKLFEAIHISLGFPLYGLTVHKPGTVLIITSEDSREMLVARLRAITIAMQLPPADVATVMQRVRIADVSGNGFKLTEVRGDVVMPSIGIEQIIAACQTLRPVLIVIDPAVSFGVGESRVNDAEQGLVEAARKLRKALDCCVQYIHHSGKQNARDKAVDQYAGRGGSAFADGARMVHVLQSLTPDEWHNETGTELHPGETGLRLARPKMSYCAPVGDILIRRKGHHFEHVVRVTTSTQSKVEAAANQVWQFLTAELSQGRYHSKNTLESQMPGLKRNELRAALDLLTVSLRIESRDVPNAGKGGKRSYLHPIASPNGAANQSEKTLENAKTLASENSVFGSPPPIGNSTAANLPPPFEPSFSYGSPNMHGEPMANLARQ